jgi:hypothetical protein
MNNKHSSMFKEKFLHNSKDREFYKEVFHNAKTNIFDPETGVIFKEYLPDKVVDKRKWKSLKRLSNKLGRWNKLKADLGEVFMYQITFKKINPSWGEIENVFDKRRYNKIVRYLEGEIKGKFIAVIEYGVEAGLHAHILAGKDALPGFSRVVQDYRKTVTYISKPLLSYPLKKGEYRANAEQLKDDWKVLGGWLVQQSKLKRRQCHTVVFRTGKERNAKPFTKTNGLFSEENL